MTDAMELFSEELIQQIEEGARTQNRKPAEVLEGAWVWVQKRKAVTAVQEGKNDSWKNALEKRSEKTASNYCSIPSGISV
jgi:hypothetical protein